MRFISLLATIATSLFSTPSYAERTLTDQEIAKVAYTHGLTEAHCDLIDLFFTDNLTRIEIYECITLKNGHLIYDSSRRFTYIAGVAIEPEPIPLPGHAVALVSKVT